MKAASVRTVSDLAQDDIVTPYTVEPLSTRGRIVRLGPSIDSILKRHDYPALIARHVGEAVALTVLLGSALKIEGGFQLQTKSDGILSMLVVDFDAPSKLRALARFDPARLDAAIMSGQKGDLLGSGHLAFTIDPGGDRARYQGVVPLDGRGLESAAHEYFQRSEQIPTLVRLAVGEIVTAAGSQWRAGGLIAQFLPDAPERRRHADLPPGDAPEGTVFEVEIEDDQWTEARAHAATTEDHELIDPTLSAERLLFRLFHERGVRVFSPAALVDSCRCSSERIDAMLQSFSPAERRDRGQPVIVREPARRNVHA